MKDFLYKKVIYYFLLLGPLLDIMTSFMIMKGYTLTIGIIFRLLVLILMVIYLIFYDKKNIKHNLIFLIIIFIFSIFNILNNRELLNNYLVNYCSYLFKYLYFLISILFYIRWYHYGKFTLNKFNIPILIIIISFLISLIANISYLSYDIINYKDGISGFFSSSNELSNLLCLLFPISLYNAFHNDKSSRISISYPIFLGIIMLLIGTKTGLLGYFITLIIYLIIRLVLIKKVHNKMGLIISLLMIIISICFYSKLPAIRNMTYYKSDNISTVIFNGRDDKLNLVWNNYKKTNLVDKLVGKYYINSDKNEIIVIEQDFYDIFFMNGILGFILIIILYLYLFKKFIKYKTENVWLLLIILLESSIAFLAGHLLLSPSISTYLGLLIALYSYNLSINKSDDKKKVMFISSIGGHLTQLLKLKSIFNDYNYILITEKCDVTKPLKDLYKVEYLVNGSRKYLFKYLFIFTYNSIKSIYYFIKYNPDVIVTTGVHTSVVMCYLGYLFRKKVIFIESFSMQTKKTLSGKLVYPIATTFVVQWRSMLKVYPKAKYFGGMY